MVQVARLLEALGRLLWSHGLVTGAPLDHRIDERGDHRVTFVVPKELAVYEPPKHHGPSLGPSVGWTTAGFDVCGTLASSAALAFEFVEAIPACLRQHDVPAVVLGQAEVSDLAKLARVRARPHGLRPRDPLKDDEDLEVVHSSTG
jgi:hypothetical protein